MGKTFEFEMIDPSSRVLDGPAWQVVMPGTEGEFGVRAGHCAMVSALKPGVVSFWRTEEEMPKKFFVGGGFAHISDTACTVLVEESVEISSLDENALRQDLQNLEDEKSLAGDPGSAELIAGKISLVQDKLLAIRHHR